MKLKPTREFAVAVASAFIEKDSKFLLVYDPKFKFWRVPGGKPKRGENVERALIREMKEELNANILIEKFLGYGQDITPIHWYGKDYITWRVLLYFKCKLTNNITVLEKHEVSKMKWLTIEEIKNHENLEPGMIDFFKNFEVG